MKPEPELDPPLPYGLKTAWDVNGQIPRGGKAALYGLKVDSDLGSSPKVEF